MGLRVGDVDKAVVQVEPCVRIVEQDRFLRAGNDDGLGGILNQVGQCGGGIGHGIGAVGDHKAVVQGVVFLQGGADLQPVGGADVGAVQVHQLHGLYVAQLPDFGHAL